jgi:hypothetical protein
MASSPLLPSMAPTKTTFDLVVFGKDGESMQDVIGTDLH